MTTPSLTPAPMAIPNKFGGDPVAFDTYMQAWIVWQAARAAEDPAFLAWIESTAATVAADRAASQAAKDAIDAQSPGINAEAAAISASEAAASALAALGIQTDLHANWQAKLDAANASADESSTKAAEALASDINAQAAAVTAQNAAITSAAAANAYSSITAANADSGLAIGASFTAPLADGSLQTYTKTASSGSSATAIGEPFISTPTMNARLSDAFNGELSTLRNLFDKSTAIDNYAIRGTDGVAVSAAGYFTSAFIKVIPGGQFILNRTIYGGSGTYGIAYFNISKGFLSGTTTGVAANTAITVPATAAFVRFSVLTLANKAGLHMVHGATMPTVFRAHDLADTYTNRTEFAARASDLLFRPTPNLFDPTAVTQGSVITSSTGVVSAAAGYFYSGYIPVRSDTTVMCSHTGITSSAYGWAFYDDAKTFIAGVAGPVTAGAAVTVPFGAAYARITMHSYTASNVAQLYQIQVVCGASIPAVHQEAGYTDAASATALAQAAMTKYHPASWNLFDIKRITSGGALLLTGIASMGGAYAAYCYTDFMPVRPGIGIVANTGVALGVSLGWVWYDRAMNYLSGTAGGTIVAGTPVTPPAAAAYVRVSWTLAGVSRLKICEGTTTPPVETYGWDDVKAQHRWAGKVLSVCGDSIMDTIDGSDVWHLSLLHRLKMTLGVNAGVSGHKMAQCWLTSVPADFASTNLVVVAYGTNDYGANATGESGSVTPTALGSISDAAAPLGGSFYATTKYMIEQLQTTNPTIRVVFITPMQRFNTASNYGTDGTVPNSLGFTLLDYCNAIKAVAALYSCPVLDQYSMLGINTLTQSIYLADGLHPNQTGYTDRVIPLSVRFLESI